MGKAVGANGTWDFWIDRGGTFTDVVGRAGRTARSSRTSCCRKIPRPIATPPCRASATCSASQAGEPIPPGRVGAVKMGTTVATNALLERKGDRTLLVTTKGFRDALRDRLPGAAEDLRQAHHQARDAVRARRRGRRARARRRHGRAGARSRRRARAISKQRCADGIKAVAIVFMHAYRYPAHEQARRRARARDGLRAGLGQPRGLAADQAGRARRHDGGRCLSLADPAALRRAGATVELDAQATPARA